jgi:type I restriction enzyme S subunit
MTGLPQGWAETTLGTLSEYITSGSRDWSRYYADQGPLFIRTQDIKTNSLDDFSNVARVALPEKVEGKRTLVLPDDILITITGANVGKVAIVPNDIPEAYVSQSVALVRLCQPEQARFLQKAIMCPQDDGVTALRGAAYGQGRPVLSLDDVRDTPIPLPPLPEQRRIVRMLDILSARSTIARTHLTAIEKLVGRYRKAVTEGLFEVLLAEHGEQEMGDLCERVTKGASPNWQGFEYAKEGIVFVRSQNVLWGALDLTDTAFLPPGFNDKQRNSVIRENDVLLNIVGASIGRSAVATAALAGANCNQAVAVIRLKVPTASDARYLSQWLTSPAAQAQITENAVDVARANFSLGQAKQLKLPWPPKEIRLQTLAKIDTAFAKIDRLKAEATKALKLLGHLDQRILAKAFSGGLVPQDPTDEPAETLLARIRAERSAAPKGRRKRSA